MAPITLAIEGKISNSDGNPPPALREVTLNFDKNGAVDATGLPVCTRSQLEMLGVKSARRTCRKSIVGSGIAHVAIASSERGSLPLPLTFFNGGVRGDTTILLIHSSVPAPSPQPIVAAMKLRRVNEGRYGLRAVVPIPPIAGGSGSVLDFSVKIKRLFTYEGARQSYAMARCPDGHLNARLATAFKDGTVMNGTLVRSCASKD